MPEDDSRVDTTDDGAAEGSAEERAGGSAEGAEPSLLGAPGLPGASALPDAPALPDVPGLALRRDEKGLALVEGDMVLRGDFTRMLPRLRTDNLRRELLVRAAKVKGVEHPVALDATAGLGEDSLLLAAAGFSVYLCERDPVIAALLRDALARAAEEPSLAEVVARMRLLEADSLAVLADPGALPSLVDVVYLDPMFPAKRKSAATKKKFQLLHRLESPCEEEEALVRAALAARPRKVVVKRPVKAPYLAGVKPSSSLEGKVVRYDCLVPPAMSR